MAQPTPYTLSYDFVGFQASNPSTPLPADKIEIEFGAIEITLGEVLDNLALIQRDDGRLKNQSVHAAALDDDVIAMISGFNPRGAWATATAYAVNDLVTKDGVTYVTLVAHTSGTFSTDLAANKWMALGGQSTANLTCVDLSASGDITVGDDLIVTDDATIGGDLAVTGGATVGGNLGVTGDLTIDDITADAIAAASLVLSGALSAASATITGDLTVDTSTLKVDSTNNRVGIGTASPSATAHVSGGNVRIEGGATGRGLEIVSGSTFKGTMTEGATEPLEIRSSANMGFYTGATSATNGTKRGYFDNSTGALLLPYQPSFSAKNSSAFTATNKMTGWTEVHDVGSNFEPTTNGRFVAPVTGTYFFYCNFANNSAPASNCKLVLYKNGSTANIEWNVGTLAYSNGGGMVAIQLTAGDYVELYVGQGTIHNESLFTRFGGFFHG